MNRMSHSSGGFLVVVLSFMCVLPLGADLVHVPDANSVALHHLDETVADGAPGGKDFVDASGNGRHGIGYDIAAGQIVLNQDGVTGGPNRAVDLQGGDTKRNVIAMYSVTNMYTGGDCTFETWIKNPGSLATADATAGRIIGWVHSTAFAWSVGLNSAGGFRIFGNNGTGSFAYSTPGLGWGAGAWYYVALVIDTAGQPAGKAQFTLYRRPLGGALTPLVSIVTNAPVNTASSDAYKLAGNTTVSTRTFVGQMDEAHLSNTARDFDYLEAHSQASGPAVDYMFHRADGNTVVLLHLEETADNLELGGADFADAGGHAHHASGYDIGSALLIDQSGIGGTRGVSMANTDNSRNAIRPWGVIDQFTGGNFTLEAWIKNPGGLATADGTTGRSIAWCKDSSFCWSLGLNSNGGIKLFANQDAPNDFAYTGPALTWDADQWYYIALVADTNGQAGGQAQYTFYRGRSGDNLEQACSVVTNACLNTAASDSLGFGGETSASVRNFRGQMDELHFSNVARPYDYLNLHFRGPYQGTLVVVR